VDLTIFHITGLRTGRGGRRHVCPGLRLTRPRQVGPPPAHPVPPGRPAASNRSLATPSARGPVSVIKMSTEADPRPQARPAVVLALISVGGALGALARYGLGVAWPHESGDFPWTTWAVNISGCFLMGILMTSLARHRPRQLYLRPFLGVGILGGYTTFSTSIVDLQSARPAVALLYLPATVIGALLAVWLGSTLAATGSSR
jgi:fluoride exporter